jgi:hypothetical protein
VCDINSYYKFFMIFYHFKHNVAYKVMQSCNTLGRKDASRSSFLWYLYTGMAVQAVTVCEVLFWHLLHSMCRVYNFLIFTTLWNASNYYRSLFSVLYKLSCTFRITLMIWMKPICVLATFESDGNIFLLNCRQSPNYLCSPWTSVFKQWSKMYQNYTG